MSGSYRVAGEQLLVGKGNELAVIEQAKAGGGPNP